MTFQQLLERAFKLVRLEQEKSRNHQELVFFIEHGTLVDIKYGMDPKQSIAANDFVYRDQLLGYHIHPVLETTEGFKPPLITLVNLALVGNISE